MTIDAEAPRPPYLQLADSLRAAIADGSITAGARLPSGRALARTYGVALNTAQRAVDELQRAGLVRSHGTRGVYVLPVAEDTLEESELEALRKDLAKLSDRVAALESKINESR